MKSFISANARAVASMVNRKKVWAALLGAVGTMVIAGPYLASGRFAGLFAGDRPVRVADSVEVSANALAARNVANEVAPLRVENKAIIPLGEEANPLTPADVLACTN
jgi:hypothetical protein